MSIEAILLQSRASKFNSQKKHEAFAREYMIDFDLVRAYKCTVALDSDNIEDDVAHKNASRLLKSAFVQNIIDQIECEFISKRKLEKELVVLQLRRVYNSAMRDKDYASANSALDKLMKHYGLYNEHNKQKKYTPQDIEAIRRRLQENGMILDSPNMPKSIDQGLLDSNGIEDAVIVKKNEES